MKCNQEQYDKYEFYSEKASTKIVDMLGGGQDVRVSVSGCSYNTFSKIFKLNMEIYWSGLFFKNNKYNIDGVIKMDKDGNDAAFSEKYANQRVKKLRFWADIAKGIYYLGTLDKK